MVGLILSILESVAVISLVGVDVPTALFGFHFFFLFFLLFFFPCLACCLVCCLFSVSFRPFAPSSTF